jgi:hypothetical protein
VKQLLFIALLLILLVKANGQSADSSFFEAQFKHGIKYSVKTSSGNSCVGFVVEETKDFIILEDRLTHEKCELRKRDIVRTERVPDTGKFSSVPMGENLHAQSYMLSGSAFLFEERKMRTNAHWLMLESIDYAFTDNWALSVNTLAFYPFTVGLKCAYQLNEETFIGGNLFGIGNVLASGNNSPLLGYGALGKFTKGTSNKNMTLSGGLIGINSDIFAGIRTVPFVNVGFISLAYCNRFSKRVALNLEGWYLPEINAGFGGVGFKFVGDEVTCWTLGCYVLMNRADNTIKVNLKTVPIPYFGVSKRFT